MLSAGELVATPVGVGQGLVERLLGTRGDVDGAALGGDRSATELGAQPLQQQGRLKTVELLEGRLDEPIRLAEEGEQQVLGVELVMPQAKQQLLDAGQSFAGFVGESFEWDQESETSWSPRPLS